MSRTALKDCTVGQLETRNRRRGYRDDTQKAKRAMELAVELGSVAAGVEAEAQERASHYKDDNARIRKFCAYRRLLMEKCPEFWEEAVKGLGGPEASAERLTGLIKDGAGANLTDSKGKDLGAADHRVRLAAGRMEMEVWRNIGKAGVDVEQLGQGEERMEIERERVKLLGKVAARGGLPFSGPIQFVFNIGSGEQVIATRLLENQDAAALPAMEEAGGVPDQSLQAVGNTGGAGRGEK